MSVEDQIPPNPFQRIAVIYNHPARNLQHH